MGRLARIFKAVAREMRFGKVRTVLIPEGNHSNLFENQCAIVTGGAGGIGFAIATKLIQNGCNVVLLGRDEKKLEAASNALGDRCSFVVGDVSCGTRCATYITDALNLIPNSQGFNILVNAAGIAVNKPFEDICEDDYNAVLDTNLKGTFFMSQAIAQHMIERKIGGHILNISSASALRPAKSPYEISKWGVKGLTLGLADTLAPYGITVNALGPGPTAGGMIKGASVHNLLHVESPIGRMAHPDEIANLAIVLLSNCGELIIGDTLYATGGAGTICIDR